MVQFKNALLSAVLAFAGLPVALPGQAVVEHAAGSGAVATVGAPFKNIGKKLSGALESSGKGLEKAARPPANRATGGPVSAQTTEPFKRTTDPPLPAASYESPDGIRAGMAYAEVLRRFGPPSMTVTDDNGRQTLLYAGKNGAVAVHVRNGDVVSVGAQEKAAEDSGK